MEESETPKVDKQKQNEEKIEKAKAIQSSSSSTSTTSKSASAASSQQPAKQSKTTTTVVTTTTRIISGASSVLSPTINSPSKQVKESSNLRKRQTIEVKQNDTNRLLEQSSGRSHSFKTSQSNSHYQTNDNFEKLNAPASETSSPNEHIAYRLYKAAGEYWNKYPKTDYTYSEKSPHRREIAPGVINMPNMSRNSLAKHDERVNWMVTNKPEQAEYIRSRYESVQNKYQTQAQVNKNLDYHYDSQDEVDLSDLNGHINEKITKTRTNYYTTSTPYRYEKAIEEESIVKRFFTSIITTLYLSVMSMTKVFQKSSEDDLYKTYLYQNEQRGIFSRILSTLLSALLYVFRRIYLLISSVLYLDSWLLQSSSRRNKRGLILFLFILLPLLLLAGKLIK